jgi:hypothetical protein
MAGFKQQLGIFVWEDPFRKAVGCRGAFSVAFGNGEAPVDISGVLGDVGTASDGDLFLREYGGKPIVRDGLIRSAEGGFLLG